MKSNCFFVSLPLRSEDTSSRHRKRILFFLLCTRLFVPLQYTLHEGDIPPRWAKSDGEVTTFHIYIQKILSFFKRNL